MRISDWSSDVCSSDLRACSVLDKLVAAVEAKGWTLDSTEQGYAIVADGETVGLMIEEKLDRVPHIVTAAELKEKAEYRSEEHTSELQSLMRISYAVFCLKKTNT